MRDPKPGDLVRTKEGFWGLLKQHLPGEPEAFVARLSDGREVGVSRGEFALMPLNYFEADDEVANFAEEMSLVLDPGEYPYRTDGPHWSR